MASYFLSGRIIGRIEKSLKVFLWGGTRRAKVKWPTICQPKDKGCFGISDLGVVNNVYIMKNICNIYEHKESRYVKWVYTVILNGKSM